jgi:hypothetical protein
MQDAPQPSGGDPSHRRYTLLFLCQAKRLWKQPHPEFSKFLNDEKLFQPAKRASPEAKIRKQKRLAPEQRLAARAVRMKEERQAGHSFLRPMDDEPPRQASFRNEIVRVPVSSFGGSNGRRPTNRFDSKSEDMVEEDELERLQHARDAGLAGEGTATPPPRLSVGATAFRPGGGAHEVEPALLRGGSHCHNDRRL